jgi:hypothetical protein
MSGSISQSLGIITLIWGGQTLNVDKSSSFSPGGPIDKMVMNGNQITYSTDQVTPSMVDAKFVLQKGQSITALKALNGSEMQIECDSGQTFTIASARLTKDIKITGGATNNCSASWGGTPATEVIAQ